MISIENILLERPSKRDVEMQGNHDYKEKHVVKNQSRMGSILSQLESTNFESQNHDHEFSIQDPHHQDFK